MSKAHWLALSALRGVGGVTIRKLIEQFGTVEAIFDALDADLLRVPRITTDVIARMRAISLDNLKAKLVQLANEGFQVLTQDDPLYPPNLNQVSSAPPLLFVRGQLQARDSQAVAIVGTRQPTPQAIRLAETLGQELTLRGLTIVSGLAIGIDTAAHRGALRAENGRTLAVLGSGLRAIHPRQNIPLAEKIVQRGALLSELVPDIRVCPANLVARDRIISGLSLAVIVVQAQKKSGSLDTANKARRQGRLLFAVPGSPGTDSLLASGAQPLQPSTIDFDRLNQRINEHTIGKDQVQQLELW
ncbi:MAG: DNA-protecting protein DprA [Chloroflexi bacterium]|nr:DNA-protecting protein DprA [Chloroflexota bacterium]